MNENLLKKYAELIVRIGVNLQSGEEAVISAPVECAKFVRIVAEECYRVGARKVMVKWYDDELSKIVYLHEDEKTIADIYNWRVAQNDEIVDRKAVVINIISENPDVFEGVSPKVMAAMSRAAGERMKRYQDSTMSGRTRWTIAAYPNKEWAKKIFPDDSEAVAVVRLWGLIFETVRMDTPDPIAAWKEHQEKLAARVKILNEANIVSLHYKNSLGTDFVIGLPDGYVFEGGANEQPDGGVFYTANMPTEEVFTAPHKYRADGKIVASMPLIHNGNRIEGFYLELKDGKIVNYHADKGEEVLKEIIDTDEGSHYLGEVALVGYNSPIQNLKTLFYNTLFDENASCHFAIGRAYPTCVKGGENLSREEQDKVGLNFSLEHVDFMLGTPDLSIVATKKDGTKLVVFKDGDWAIS